MYLRYNILESKTVKYVCPQDIYILAEEHQVNDTQ